MEMMDQGGGVKGDLEKCVKKLSSVCSSLSNDAGRLSVSKQYMKGCQRMYTIVDKALEAGICVPPLATTYCLRAHIAFFNSPF